MAPEPGVLSRMVRLAAEVDVDRAALGARSTEVRELLERWGRDGALAREGLIVLAVNLHGWYTALETPLERVARLLDVPSLRPAVLPAEALGDLQELRRFRHFFRNAYVLDVDPVRIREHADRLRRVAPDVEATLDAFRRHLSGVVQAVSKS